MFDKLIVSEPEGADFRNRRSYFMVSSFVVGILFVTAVVISIYAADYGLGSRNFELSDLIAPADMAAVAPEPPKQQIRTTTQSSSTSKLPTRQVNMQNLVETPIVPTTISTAQNTQKARPEDGRFIISNVNTDPDGSNGIPRNIGDPGEGTQTLGTNIQGNTKPPVEADPPPRIEKKDPPAPKSGGVLNGKATSLPKPTYSAAAKAIGAQGQVTVQVLIDERGNVVSANASNGHPLLRPEAERAARGAKFSTTYLSGVPVKVTGVIVYNFVR
ncbi:MAG TPA: energy transducer TonB [Pyrinomonadaceae bacterium]|nr:energy transducer TonB [Pyrinomonadaceae bacterium]